MGLKALKPAVFLVGNGFRLRIPLGKLIRFPNLIQSMDYFSFKYIVLFMVSVKNVKLWSYEAIWSK